MIILDPNELKLLEGDSKEISVTVEGGSLSYNLDAELQDKITVEKVEELLPENENKSIFKVVSTSGAAQGVITFSVETPPETEGVESRTETTDLNVSVFKHSTIQLDKQEIDILEGDFKEVVVTATGGSVSYTISSELTDLLTVEKVEKGEDDEAQDDSLTTYKIQAIAAKLNATTPFAKGKVTFKVESPIAGEAAGEAIAELVVTDYKQAAITLEPAELDILEGETLEVAVKSLITDFTVTVPDALKDKIKIEKIAEAKPDDAPEDYVDIYKKFKVTSVFDDEDISDKLTVTVKNPVSEASTELTVYLWFSPKLELGQKSAITEVKLRSAEHLDIEVITNLNKFAYTATTTQVQMRTNRLSKQRSTLKPDDTLDDEQLPPEASNQKNLFILRCTGGELSKLGSTNITGKTLKVSVQRDVRTKSDGVTKVIFSRCIDLPVTILREQFYIFTYDPPIEDTYPLDNVISIYDAVNYQASSEPLNEFTLPRISEQFKLRVELKKNPWYAPTPVFAADALDVRDLKDTDSSLVPEEGVYYFVVLGLQSGVQKLGFQARILPNCSYKKFLTIPTIPASDADQPSPQPQVATSTTEQIVTVTNKEGVLTSGVVNQKGELITAELPVQFYDARVTAPLPRVEVKLDASKNEIYVKGVRTGFAQVMVVSTLGSQTDKKIINVSIVERLDDEQN